MKNSKLFGLILCLALSSNCYACSEQPKRMIVSGVLKYFPENVRSREAWYGHNFMIGDTPIQSWIITKKELFKFVGKHITVDGRWFEGAEWRDGGDFEQSAPTPIEATLKSSIYWPVMRNDGIRVEKIQLLDK